MNGFGLHVIPMVGLILLSWLGLRSLGMVRGAPPAAPGWPSGCTFLLEAIALKRELDDSSMISTPPEKEPVVECSLMLTTLSGVTFQVSLSVAKFDRFEDPEDQVMDYLVSVDLKVFGCSIDFLQTATQTYLEDPIWDKLQQGMACTIVFRKQCYPAISRTIQDCPIHHIPLAVHVPMNPEEIVPEGAFAGVPRLRHVSAESGIRLIGAEAWQNCRQLRIVKLPATVVAFPMTPSVTANY